MINLKHILLFAILICSTTVPAEEKNLISETELIRTDFNSIQKNSFYAVYNQFLIPGFEPNHDGKTSYLESFLKKKMPKWQKISSHYLNDYGLRTGMEIQYVNLETGLLKTYTIRDEVYVAMVPNWFASESPGENAYRTFYVLLDDSNKNININNFEEFDNADKPNGLAYAGTEFKLKDGKKQLVNEGNAISKDDSNVQSILKGFSKNHPEERFEISKASSSQVSGHTFYHLEGNVLEKDRKGVEKSRRAGNIVSKIGDNKYYEFMGNWSWGDYDEYVRNYTYVTSIQDVDWAVFIQDSGQHACSNLYIFKNKEVKTYKIRCDSGGD